MNRKEALTYISQKYPYNKYYGRFTKADIKFMEDFIAENDGLSRGDFELKINRIFLGMKDKPKMWTHMQEVLTCLNSAANKP